MFPLYKKDVVGQVLAKKLGGIGGGSIAYQLQAYIVCSGSGMVRANDTSTAKPFRFSMSQSLETFRSSPQEGCFLSPIY